MQISVNFFTPGPQKIYAVNEDTGRDLRCLTDTKWLTSAATCKLFLVPIDKVNDPNYSRYELAGQNIHMGNASVGDIFSQTWQTYLLFEAIQFTAEGLFAACIEVTEDGKTLTSLPFYLMVERSIS